MRPVRCATLALAATALTLPLLATPASAAAPSGHHRPGQPSATTPSAHGPHHGHSDRLRKAAPEGFHVGTAVAGGGHHLEQDYPDPFTHDREYRKVLAKQFNSVSPENQMKWEFLRPERDRYDFEAADAIVDFAERHGQVVRGHTLLWHSQNPEWLEEGEFTDAELRALLREHITTVVGRYAGRIQQWDVANEIFDEEGGLRTEENIWIRQLGPEIIADAFRWAHQADPEAKLFFNDYNVEGENAKSDAYYVLIQDLLAQGVPVDGFSVQGHLSLAYDFPDGLERNLTRFDELGLETAITELDVRMELAEDGQPTKAQLRQQADYYQRALTACLAVEECNSFTIWGFTDTYSWVPVFFEGEGAATVMTEDYVRKPAFSALHSTLHQARHDDRHDDRPGHGKPGHGKPGHGKPGHGKPGHGKPGHGKPGHGRPGHDPHHG